MGTITDFRRPPHGETEQSLAAWSLSNKWDEDSVIKIGSTEEGMAEMTVEELKNRLRGEIIQPATTAMTTRARFITR